MRAARPRMATTTKKNRCEEAIAEHITAKVINIVANHSEGVGVEQKWSSDNALYDWVRRGSAQVKG